MKIALYSDLHLEINQNVALKDILHINPDVEVVILAGDIGNEATIKNVVEEIHQQAPNAKILYVLGNHEYYHHFFIMTKFYYQKALKPFEYVKLLENDVYLDQDNKIAFIGATLWTDFELLGKKKKAMHICQKGLNDYRLIRHLDEKGDVTLLKPEDTCRLFKTSIKYIEKMAKKYKEEGYKICVITHHAPMLEAIENKYLNIQDERRFISSAFASNISCDLINMVNVWCYGHTHNNMQYTHTSGAKIISNQLGYLMENIKNQSLKEAGNSKTYYSDFLFEL